MLENHLSHFIELSFLSTLESVTWSSIETNILFSSLLEQSEQNKCRAVVKQEWLSVHATCVSFHIFIHNLSSFRRIGRISHTIFSLYPANIVEFKLKCISDATQYNLGSGFPSGHLWSLNEQLKNKFCLENEVATNKGITKLMLMLFRFHRYQL